MESISAIDLFQGKNYVYYRAFLPTIHSIHIKLLNIISDSKDFVEKSLQPVFIID